MSELKNKRDDVVKKQQHHTSQVKVFFRPLAFGTPITDLEEDLADVLSKFYAGKKTVCEKLPSEDLSVGCKK